MVMGLAQCVGGMAFAWTEFFVIESNRRQWYCKARRILVVHAYELVVWHGPVNLVLLSLSLGLF